MISSVILGIGFLLEASILGIGVKKLLRVMNKTLQHGRGEQAASRSVPLKPITFQNDNPSARPGSGPSGKRRRSRISSPAPKGTARKKKDPVSVGSAKPYQIDIRKA